MPKPTPRPPPTNEQKLKNYFWEYDDELIKHMSAYNTITSFEKNVLPEHNTNLNNLKLLKEYYANYIRDILDEMPVIPESGGSIKPKQNKTKKIRNN
jgi:hypothetical protein